MEPVLKYYTVADLKQWLLHNKPADGLSERIIAPTRAYAIMNNPYVKDEDAVVSAIFEDGEPAAFTAAFPEILERPKGKLAWWFSTLYCRPESVGKGYGLIVVGQLCEMIGEGNFFDMDGAKETVEIFNYLGLTTTYFTHYLFSFKKINIKSFLGPFAYIRNIINLSFYKKRLHDALSRSVRYTLRYVNIIDDEIYNFIKNNSKKDLILRQKKMFNWIISYPFMQDTPIIDKINKDNYFTSSLPLFSIKAVCIYIDSQLIGFFILRNSSWNLSVKYLYYIPEYEEVVFMSILEHIRFYNNSKLSLNNLSLYRWIDHINIFQKLNKESKSFSYPCDFLFDDSLLVQAGDGDMFV